MFGFLKTKKGLEQMKKVTKKIIASLAASTAIFTGTTVTFAHGTEDLAIDYVEVPKEANYGKVLGAMSKKDRADLAEAMKATAKYHDIQNAINDGYEQEGPFAVIPGVGGMGVHYTNHSIEHDTVLDPSQPETLLYEVQPNGSLKLIGVEYHVDANLVDPHKDPIPSLFGQTFDGPMLNHHIITAGLSESEKETLLQDRSNFHYDLHVWVWKHNSNGLFAMWNPKVTDKSVN